jgi:hypothetical protein
MNKNRADKGQGLVVNKVWDDKGQGLVVNKG